ncbi:hypothetical protein TWF506_010758 [Arthrobotrys conoides]|uniref:Uncharacterized protein n=1 Tax=Arthrobotrys conoides TaxID=74498 RepID=A0AAN8RSJ1_9PEZI
MLPDIVNHVGGVSACELAGNGHSSCSAGLPLEMSEGEIEDQVKNCGSFLIIQDHVVFFAHQSTKDFLDKSIGSCLIIPNGLGCRHREILTRCLQQLQTELETDICNLNRPDFDITELRPEDKYAINHLRYSCYYWINHLALVELPTAKSDLVLWFLEKHLLYWMELMIILDPSLEILTMVKYLESTMEVCRNLTHDFYR